MKRSVVFFFALLVCAGAASAQAPRIQVRTAFGASNYLHGDIEYTAPTVVFGVRVGTERFAIEPEVAFAWHEERQSFSSVTGPIVVERSEQFRSVGVNAIARGRGRISPFFGGGIGMYSGRRRTATNGQESTLTRGPRPGTQIVGGIDVRVAPRITVFGQGRFEIRSFADPGGGSVAQGLAGVSIALR